MSQESRGWVPSWNQQGKDRRKHGQIPTCIICQYHACVIFKELETTSLCLILVTVQSEPPSFLWVDEHSKTRHLS